MRRASPRVPGVPSAVPDVGAPPGSADGSSERGRPGIQPAGAQARRRSTIVGGATASFRRTVSLRSLPGVGPYTAAAVASSRSACLSRRSTRTSGASSRGVRWSRRRPVPRCRARGAWLHRRDPGAWNQALMDLGREVCRPRPRCGACPLRGTCRAVALDAAAHAVRSAGSRLMRQARGAAVVRLGACRPRSTSPRGSRDSKPSASSRPCG
jgi:hypothetical protein